MKLFLTALLLSALSVNCFSQTSWDNYFGRPTPLMKQSKLQGSKFMTDIIPGYYNLIDFISTEISVVIGGKKLSSSGTSDILTAGQKNILSTADLDNSINIKITFTYKDAELDNQGGSSKLKELIFSITPVPEVEAEFPGGEKQLKDHLIEAVTNKLTDTVASKKILNAIVKFTVNEQGEITEAKIIRTSTDPKIDELLLEATNKMPKWKPAENVNGIKIKREMSVPFREGC